MFWAPFSVFLHEGLAKRGWGRVVFSLSSSRGLTAGVKTEEGLVIFEGSPHKVKACGDLDTR